MREENNVGALLSQTANAYNAYITRQLREYDVTYSQALILRNLICDHQGVSTQQDIKNELNLSAPALCGTLSRLEANGFICKEGAPKDSRANAILATDKAKALMPAILEKIRQGEAQILAPLTDLQITVLQAELNGMLETLRNC